MRALQVVGALCLLGSGICFARFQSEMRAVAVAKSEANQPSIDSSGDPRAESGVHLAEADEARHRNLAKNWFLSGTGLVVGGAGLVIVPALRKRRAARTSEGKHSP